MIEPAASERIEKLRTKVTRLEDQVDDLKDLCDLENAIKQNGDKPLIPWEQAKKQLDLG
jgi:hypothetical protein